MIELDDSKKKKIHFIEYVRDRLEVEIPLLDILKNYKTNFAKGQMKKEVDIFVKGIERGDEFSDLLIKKKYVNKMQGLILENSGSDMIKALTSILETSQTKDGLSSAYLSAFFKFFLGAGTFLGIGLFPDSMVTMVTAMSIAPDPMKFLPFYLKEPMWLVAAGVIPLIVVILIFVYYQVNRNSNPFYIYKFSSVDEYDDGIMIISILKALHEADVQLQEGFSKLAETTKNKAHKKMFKSIYNSYENGESKIVDTFKHFGFSSTTYERLELIESGGEVELNLAAALKILERNRDRKVKTISKMLPEAAGLFSMLVIGLLAIHLFAKQFDASLAF